MPGTGGTILRTAADGLVSAATRSILTGTSFGDNVLAVLPEVIGRSVGNAMADALSDAVSAAQLKRERAAAAHEAAHAADAARPDFAWFLLPKESPAARRL